MGILDKWFTRRRGMPRFDGLAPRVQRRLVPVCQELNEAEDELATRLGLPRAPRLLLVDEEEAVILTPEERAGICRHDGDAGPHQPMRAP